MKARVKTGFMRLSQAGNVVKGDANEPINKFIDIILVRQYNVLNIKSSREVLIQMSSVQVMPGAESVLLKGSSGRGILLLHGFTGNPCEMRYLGEQLHAYGHTVYIPRYPGHGTSLSDMLQTSADDWFTYARNAYIELSGEVDDVFIAGLSMGGVFTILITHEFSPARIVLISTPHYYENPGIYLLPMAGLLVKVLPIRNKKKGINSLEHRAAHICYEEGVPVKQLWQLFRYIKKAMKALPEIRSEVLILHSRGDELIPGKSAEFIFDKIGSLKKKKVIFTKSNHCLTNDYDRDAVSALIKDFFS